MAENELADLIVGDRFWLRRAQVLVEGSVGRPHAAAIRLMTTIAWFWGVYSGAAIVGVALGARHYPAWQAVVLASPAVLLVVAYGAALWATLPVYVAFDPRIPAEVRGAHEHIARQKRVRLALALVLTFMAALGVAMSVVVAAVSSPHTS
jgi:hypothetical protein